jgi:hypothetical protein
MKFSEAKSKICPFMSARFNLSSHPRENNPNLFYCSVNSCMSWVTTKTHVSIPSGSALYDDIGDELSFSDKEGYCILLERDR